MSIPSLSLELSGTTKPGQGEERTGPQLVSAVGGTRSSGGSNALAKPRTRGLSFAKVREIREDATVELCRTFVIAPALEAGWVVEADPDCPDEVIDFVKGDFDGIHDHVMRSALLGQIDFGFQAYEKVLELRDDGLVHLKKLKDLLPELTEILVDADTGAFAGLKNRSTELEVEESLLISQDVEGTNWYGRSTMSRVWRIMEKVERVEQNADLYDAKVAGTHWVVKYPLGKTLYNEEGELDNGVIAQKILARLEAQGNIAVPNLAADLPEGGEGGGWSVEMLTDSGQGQAPMIERLKYLDVQKVRCFGCPERAILEGEYGTKAEAETHGDLAVTNVNVRRVETVRHVNWHVVDHLVRANFGEELVGTVRLVPRPVSDARIKYYRELFNKALEDPANASELWDGVDFNRVRAEAGIPIRPDEPEEVPAVVPGEPPVSASGRPGGVLGKVHGAFRGTLNRVLGRKPR